MDPRDAALDADISSRLTGVRYARKAIQPGSGPRRYLITAAQNNTHVHPEFFRNLEAYCAWTGAELLISRFAYNTSAYAAKDSKAARRQADNYDASWYDPAISPYVFDDQLQITSSLTFCGELNVLPTAQNPLAGYTNYTGRASMILPHAKQEMRSIAGMRAAKFIYSTGACTLRNYIQRGAGMRAEYHHAYGALVVEVDNDGAWFVRQIRATEDGNFQDLDVVCRDGYVTVGNAVEAINWGDIHVAQLDPDQRKMNWGKGGILDTLQPRHQFMHDTLDFYARNHHEMKNPHAMFARYVNGTGSVRAELDNVSQFLFESGRPWCQTVVVDSNHDEALMRWLKEADFREDPENALLFLDAQRLAYASIANPSLGGVLPQLLRRGRPLQHVRFLESDESYVICPEAGGIECGMHGHLGSNGSRGSAAQFARMGRRVNIGHSHSATIIGDAFQAGVSGKLQMSYNRGPSSWSHSHIVTYPNGCRAIVTAWKGRWRA